MGVNHAITPFLVLIHALKAVFRRFMRDIIILSCQIKPVLISILPQIYLQKIVHFILQKKYQKYATEGHTGGHYKGQNR